MLEENNIIHGSVLDVPVSQESLGVQIFNALVRNAEDDEIAQIDVTNNITITYSSLLKLTLQVTKLFQQLGLKKDDILSVCSENQINFFLPVFAAFINGLVVAPINHTYEKDELLHVLRIAKPKIIFCSKSTIPKFISMFRRKEIPFVRYILMLETIEETLQDIKVDAKTIQPRIVSVQDTALILFSSGTTGLPKGVMITHDNINIRHAQMRHGDYESPNREYTLNVGPFYHAMGLYYGINNLILKEKIFFMQKFQEDVYLKTIQDFKITLLYAVPPVIVFLAKSPLVGQYDLSSVKEILSGAAPLSKDIEELVVKRLNVSLKIRQAYGMTETTLGVIITPNDGANDAHVGSTGKVLPGISCIVRDPESGQSLGPNKVGELCFKGGLLMKGYYNNEQATRDIFTKDGWLRSGDLGYYDKDEYFYIVDRLKELIKFKGFQVPPAELEALLLTNPKIKEAAVIGLPDEKAGELPLAFVVTQPGAKLTESEVKEFVANKVSYAKRLHGGVRFLEVIPKNMSGKILRRVLRDSLKVKANSKL